MEHIDMGQEFLAIVDFAHTPNALRAALSAARQLVGEKGRLIAVFGSAGLRDRAKRRMMAELSTELADLTVLTAEDPRTESLDGILTEMAAGASKRGGVEGRTFWRIPTVARRIQRSSLAQPGDVVIALGKGHEQSCVLVKRSTPGMTGDATSLSEFLGMPVPSTLPANANKNKLRRCFLAELILLLRG
jgi:UDP-N-acetylmuramoyl-L-alanyl-D-glutamate--2,6-diaminopimelate ligase